MGYWVCLVLMGLVLLIDLLCLESELLSWRNARRHRYSLETLQFATGIERRAELEAIVGEPGPDWLYVVPPETWARLPREAWWWRVGDWVLPPSLLSSAACLILTLQRGEPQWALCGAALTLFLTSILVAFLHVARREFEDHEDGVEFWDEEEFDRKGLLAGCRNLSEGLDQELANVEKSLRRYQEHGDMTWLERTLFSAGERYLRRKLRSGKVEAAHMLETSEAIQQDLWVHREAARRCIARTDDPEWAAFLCEMELTADEGLSEILGEQRSEEDDDPYGVNQPYDPWDPLS